jgi:hypothetical protein
MQGNIYPNPDPMNVAKCWSFTSTLTQIENVSQPIYFTTISWYTYITYLPLPGYYSEIDIPAQNWSASVLCM